MLFIQILSHRTCEIYESYIQFAGEFTVARKEGPVLRQTDRHRRPPGRAVGPALPWSLSFTVIGLVEPARPTSLSASLRGY
jgi:hypothetical protein